MWSESITCPQRSTWLVCVMTHNDARLQWRFTPVKPNTGRTSAASKCLASMKGSYVGLKLYGGCLSNEGETFWSTGDGCADEISVKWKDAAAFSTADWIVSSSAEGDAHHSAWRDSTKQKQSDTSWIGSNRARRTPQCSWSRVYGNMLVRRRQWMQRLTLPGEKDGLSPQNSSELIWIKNYFF